MTSAPAPAGAPSAGRRLRSRYDARAMRHLARRVLRFASALSLLLLAAVCALWVLSLVRTDTLGWVGWDDRTAQTWQGYGVTSRNGWLTAYYFTSGTARFDDPPHSLRGV